MTYAEYSESDYNTVETDNEMLVRELAKMGAPMDALQLMAVQVRIASLIEELVESNAIHLARFDLRYETHLNQGLQALKTQALAKRVETPAASRLIIPGRP